jgi:hypothetical protein
VQLSAQLGRDQLAERGDLLGGLGCEREPGVETDEVEVVRWMLEECRQTLTPMRVAVTSRLIPVPAWKLQADRIFVQVAYSIDDLLRWREAVDFAGEV